MNEQMNEGFWDAALTAVKQANNKLGAKFGSKAALGKFDSQHLATSMYDAYKYYINATNEPNSPKTMASFLQNEIGLPEKFVGTMTPVMLGNPDAEIKPLSADEQEQVIKQETPEEKPETNDDNQERKEPFVGKDNSENDRKSKEIQAEIQYINKANKALPSLTEPKGELGSNPASDGGVIFVTSKTANKFKEVMELNKQVEDDEYADLQRSSNIEKAGLLRRWNDVEAALKDNDLVGDRDESIEVLAVAMQAAEKLVGATDFEQAGERYVVSVPKPMKESLVEATLMEISDRELRDIFLRISQEAFKQNMVKISAEGEISWDIKPEIDYTDVINDTEETDDSETDDVSRETSKGYEPESTGDAEQDEENKKATDNLNVPVNPSLKKALDDYEGTDIASLIKTGDKGMDAIAKTIVRNTLNQYYKGK